MSDNNTEHSGELIHRDTSALIVIDVQEKLIEKISNSDRMVWNITRLARGAAEFDVPVFATEQYPSGLGSTVESLQSYFPEPVEKTRFSCAQCTGIVQTLRDAGRFQVVLAGIESHVCVVQSALELMGLGFRVFVVEDAVSGRFPDSHRLAMLRLSASGATLLPTESALFEWCEDASDPQFKAISGLVREDPPESERVVSGFMAST
jgi:nicotinamidase-related amidase